MSETRNPRSVASFLMTFLAVMGATVILLIVLEQFGLVPTGWRLVALGVGVGVAGVAIESLVNARRARRNDYSR